MASLLRPDAAGLAQAGERLRAGLLVAFPTETVYGLGANALDPAAVLSIFHAKGRPLTDPLIVHVPALEDAARLVDLSPAGRAVFDCLARAFWPGPLTLVAKAVPALPLTVSAQTGFVGLRCPAHPVAQRLLREARVPVAAPSANRFGHVSPTSAAHVLHDLGASANLSVVDDAGQEGGCRVGIESTVAKVVPEARQLVVFRRGGVSELALQRVLDAHAAALGGRYEVVAVQPPPAARASGAADAQEPEAGVAQQAPGQLLTHYAPDVDTYLIQPDAAEEMPVGGEEAAQWVVVDFGGALAALRPRALAYQDLSAAGDVPEASRRIFDALRWAEAVPGVARVLVADVSRVGHEHAAALHDRMFRAASGKCRALRL